MLKISVILFVLLLLTSAGTAILEAWLDWRKTPREPMKWCSKHGLVREARCLPLFPGLTQKDGKPFLMCPRCVHESWTAAEEKK